MSGVFKTGYFQSFDRTGLFYRIFIKDPAFPLLIIAHGHGEHSGRYEKFLTYLDGVPISLALFDLRGNGRSHGREVYVDCFDDYVRDLSSFQRFMCEQFSFSGKTVFLGHSLGGLIVCKWLIENPNRAPAAVIFSSPCFGLNSSPLLLLCNEMIQKIFPGFVYQNPIYPPYLTRSVEETVRYRSDPLIKRKITARLAAEMSRVSKELLNVAEIAISCPVMIMSGDQEKIVDFKATEQVYSKLKAPHKELQIFKGFCHEIFNEVGQEKAFECLRSTLLKVIA